MYRQHFGLTHHPLGKQTAELYDGGRLAALKERFDWLLHAPGVGLLTGLPGVGKTAALRALTAPLSSSLLAPSWKVCGDSRPAFIPPSFVSRSQVPRIVATACDPGGTSTS